MTSIQGKAEIPETEGEQISKDTREKSSKRLTLGKLYGKMLFIKGRLIKRCHIVTEVSYDYYIDDIE